MSKWSGCNGRQNARFFLITPDSQRPKLSRLFCALHVETNRNARTWFHKIRFVSATWSGPGGPTAGAGRLFSEIVLLCRVFFTAEATSEEPRSYREQLRSRHDRHAPRQQR
jgi:hypothetical protein